MSSRSHLILTAISFAAVLTVLTGCSSDSSPADLPDLSDKVYTGAGELNLTYNGVALPGKSARISTVGGMTSLELYAEFDLSQLSGFGLSGSVPAPGVLPGSVQLSIPISPVASGNSYSFSGKGATAGVEYLYSGSATSSTCTIALSDVKLKQSSPIMGAWKPAPLTKSNGFVYTSSPLYIKWQIDPAPGLEFDPGILLNMLANYPCIPVYHNTAYCSAAQLLGEVLKSIAFLPDGRIVTRYMDSSQGALQLMTTSGTGTLYAPVSSAVIALYPNPLSWASWYLVHKAALPQISIPGEMLQLAGGMIATLAPAMAEGIPMGVADADGKATLYLPTEVAVKVLASAAATIAQNPQVKELMLKALLQYPELKEYLPMVEQLLAQFPALLEKTTVFELGLNLVI